MNVELLWNCMASCGRVWPCVALCGLVWPCVALIANNIMVLTIENVVVQEMRKKPMDIEIFKLQIILLELRQYKNNLIQSKKFLVLKLSRVFPYRIGNEKAQ